MTGPLVDWPSRGGRSAVTVGVFDGVHLGHREIIRRLTESGLPVTVLTFDPHPAEVLGSVTSPRLITTIEERLALLETVGVDRVGVLDLGEIRFQSPEEFVNDVLVKRLGSARVAVGPDFRFGHDRAGDVASLMGAARRHGFEVEVVDPVTHDGVISSSRIREAIEFGELDLATAMLGSRFRLGGEVVRGDSRGREIGFPTANIDPPRRKVIPQDGIYAALARVDGNSHRAAVSIGVRPTFGGGRRLVEAHLLDFEGDLYGKHLTLEFVARIRPELMFRDVDALVARMEEDVTLTRSILDQEGPVTG